MRAGLFLAGSLSLWMLSTRIAPFESTWHDPQGIYFPSPRTNNAAGSLKPFFAEIGSNDVRLTQFGSDGDVSYIANTPDVAFNSDAGQHLVVWAGSVAGDQEIYARLFDEDGTALTDQLKISDMGTPGNINFDANTPAVAYNSTRNEYLVAWQGDDVTNDEFEIFVQAVSVTGTAGSLSLAEVGTDDMRISTVGSDGVAASSAFFPDVAYDHENNRFLVVWYADPGVTPLVDNEYEIFGQMLVYDGNGVLSESGGDFRISDMGGSGNSTYNGFDPRVVYNAGSNEYLVVWHGDDNIAPLVDNEFEIFGQRISIAGSEVGTNNDFRISSAGPDGSTTFRASRASVACNTSNSQYLVVWEADDDTSPLVDNEVEIFGQLLTSLGAATGPDDFRISDMGVDGTVTFAAQFAEVAYNSSLNQYFVVWEGDDTTDGEMEIYGQSIDATGGAVGVDERISDAGPDGDINYNATSGCVIYNPSRVEYLIVWRMDDNAGALIDNEYELYGQRFAQADDEPSAQPTSPVVTNRTDDGFTLTFTAASGTPDGYLVLRRAGSSPTEVPADNLTYTVGTALGSSTVAYVGAAVTFNESALSANTTYHYDFFSYNGVGSSINYRTASPLQGSATTLAEEPSGQAAGITFTTVSTTSVTFNITNGNGSSRVVVGRAGASVNIFPQDGSTYTANNAFGSGSLLGSGNYVVAIGDGPVTVTGLSTATTYHFRVFELNGSATQTNYNTGSATGNPASTSTLSIQPASQPTSLSFTGITSSSMDGSFTAAAGPPSGYIVLRKAGASPADVPIDGQSYSAGGAIGSSQVAFSGTATSFVSSDLSAGTEYFYAVYAFNGSGSNTNYLTSSPLEGNRVTLASEPSSQPTALNFNGVSPTSMEGTFAPASDDPDGYIVIRRASTSPTETPVDATTYTAGTDLGSSHIVAVGSGTTFSSTDLTPETLYAYDVFAFNGSGQTLNYLLTSPLEGSQTTLAEDAGSAVSDIVFSGHTSSAFTVEFTAAATPVDGYLVVRKTGAAPTGVPADGTTYTAGSAMLDGDPVIYTGATPSFAQSGLSPGTEYHYVIFPFNGSGDAINYHTSGTTNKGSTVTLPEAPVVLDAINITSSSFKAKWETVAGATSYEIDVSLQNDFSTHVAGYPLDVGNTLEATVTGLPSVTTYFYVVRAKNASGYSSYGNTVSVTTNTTGGAPLAVADPLTFVPVFPVQLTSTAVSAQVTGGTGNKTVTLFHRPITSVEEHSASPMTAGTGTSWSVVLPAAALDELGLEFYVRAEDASGSDESETYYIYKALNAGSGKSIPFSSAFNGNTSTYQMFSIPYELSDKDVENLFDVALGGYDNTRWRMFHYQGGSHREYPTQFVEIRLGEGYWFNTVVQDFQINVGEGSVALVNQTTPFNKSLEAGWNQIGNPLPFNLSWDAVRGANEKIGPLWFFRNGAYTKSDIFKPWTGAFVHADEAMTLSIPVSAKTASSGRKQHEGMDTNLDAAQWMLPITLRIESLQQTSGVGMHPGAKESKDRFDEITLPRFADYAEMKTYHDEFFSHDFSTDIVPTNNHQEWMFEVESSLDGGYATITWDHTTIAAGQASLVMVDITDGKWVDMKAVGSYAFTYRPGRQLKIIYSREGEIRPGVTLLGEVYPNPFTDVVHIPLLIGEPGYRQIEIYDGLGRMIRKLSARFEKTGLHEMTWNTKDDRSDPIPSGILYFRLTGGSGNKVTRVIIN